MQSPRESTALEVFYVGSIVIAFAGVFFYFMGQKALFWWLMAPFGLANLWGAVMAIASVRVVWKRRHSR